jgi:hypothetical protein
MVEQTVEKRTLREMLSEAERLMRELDEHLDQSFIPKCHELTRLVRPINGEPPDLGALEDVTVRTHAARVLESNVFAQDIFANLSRCCQAIELAVGRIVSEG